VRLNEAHPSDGLSGFIASHPPSPERVAANIETAARLPKGGKLGADEYKLKIQKTLDVKPAYDAYDEGREALADGKADEALALANKAIKQFPAEGHFYALQGDVRLTKKDYSAAVKGYSNAIDRDDQFFYYPLQRGIAKKELKDLDGAERDLRRSLELMPTAPAAYALGNIAEQRGRIDEALQHYKAVAKAGGKYGEAAQRSMARLEIPRNPEAYFAQRCDADTDANLVVSVQNRAGVDVSNVVVAVEYTDSAGRAQRLTREITGRLQHGQVAQVNTGLGPYAGGNCPARVIAAQVL
jgi:tetratricopeptide (TPR) repeat protein